MTGDLKYALRALAGSPLFATTAVISLALGIGANTAVFSVLNALLWRPAPGVDSNGLIAVMQSPVRSPSVVHALSYPDYRDFAQSEAFAGLAAYSNGQPLSLNTPDFATDSVTGEFVSPNYFQVLGVRLARGPGFAPADTGAAVISDGVWKRRFGGSVDAIGARVRLNGREFTVAGVAPPGFRGIRLVGAPDLWLPLAASESLRSQSSFRLRERGTRFLTAIGRLRPGDTIQRAQLALERVAARLAREYPATNADKTAAAIPAGGARFTRRLTGGAVPLVTMLLAAVALVLLLACANLANLLLARGLARTREMGIRAALGAGRARLMRQLLTETALVAAAGGVAGVLLARVALAVFRGVRLPLGVDVSLDLALDWRVLGFALLATLATAALFGMLPAAQAVRIDLARAIQPGSRDAGAKAGSRWRNALAVAEVAGAAVLLAGAGLFVRTLQRTAAIDAGFDTRNVTLARIDLGRSGYDDRRSAAFHREIGERLRALPGAPAFALSASVPLAGGSEQTSGWLEGDPGRPDAARPLFYNVVAPGYLRAMSIPLLRGRDFDEAAGPPVVIVSETAARRFWPGQDPLGKRLRAGAAGKAWREVIGVARDIRHERPWDPPEPFAWLPLAQVPQAQLAVQVRKTGPAELAAHLRQIDPHLAVLGISTLDDEIRALVEPQRVIAWAMGIFGTVALALAATGIYGVLASLVSRRTREIGIRMALGASAADVLRPVVLDGARLVVAGLAIGLGLAAAAGQWIASYLCGLSPSDPAAFAGVCAVLAAAALAASAVPTWRAIRVDPAAALRAE